MGGHVCAFCSEWLKLGMVVEKGRLMREEGSWHAILVFQGSFYLSLAYYFCASHLPSLSIFSYSHPIPYHLEAGPMKNLSDRKWMRVKCVCVLGGCFYFCLALILFLISAHINWGWCLWRVFGGYFHSIGSWNIYWEYWKPSYGKTWILNTLLSYPIRYWSYWNFLYGEKKLYPSLFDILWWWWL